MHARAVRGRGNGAGDGDVRQRGQVVQRISARVDHRRQIAIGHAPAHCHRARFLVEVISSRFKSEIWFCVLSAMRLKECREPSALSLAQLFTTCRTSSTEAGLYRRLVLKVRLPAQFSRGPVSS